MNPWSDTGDQTAGAGGFYAENGMGTPGNQSTSKAAARQQFLCPVTIRQVLEAPEDGLKVGTFTVTMVSLCGIVTNVDVTSTNVKFTLSDDTGVIECLEWLESDDGQDIKTASNIMENAYYQVFGCIKSPQGHRRIMVFKVVPVEDLNDYTAFMAEVLAVNQYAIKMNEGGADVSMPYQPANNANNANNFNNTNNYNNPAASNNDSFTPIQRTVLEAIKGCSNAQIGWDKKDPALRNKFPAKQIDDAVDFLTGEGHIYSTIDDDHFLST